MHELGETGRRNRSPCLRMAKAAVRPILDIISDFWNQNRRIVLTKERDMDEVEEDNKEM